MIRRPWALPLVALYWAGLRGKDALRAAGILRTHSLATPVVSVGSISAGGAGKTPVVIALAHLLRDAGWAVDVLSRGYARQTAHIAQVDPASPNPARIFGDEPVLIARATGAPVWVGADRFAAGRLAEQSAPTRLHLLDDGFQHRRVGRCFDIVLVTAADLDDALLPAGNRRESLRALRRAHAIVLRRDEHAAIEPRIRRYLHSGTPIWTIDRALQVPEAAAQLDLLAFSGLARPQNFVDMLKSCGLRVIDSVSFPDHHRYTAADMHRLCKRLRSSNATGFITTEKDAVKITPELRTVLEAAAPLAIAPLRVTFDAPADVLAALEARCP